MRPGSISARAERTTSTRGAIRAAAGDPPKKKPELKKVMPEVWRLVRPRRWLLLFGLVLVAINRARRPCAATLDEILHRRCAQQTPRRQAPAARGTRLLSTAIQAVTSFSLTQLLSKAAQRMIADLRRQVQQHVGRLSVGFYDANRTGVLVSRIMSDVEGVRNLVGTGLVEFVGGLLTAVLCFFFLLRSSHNMTLIVFAVIVAFVVVLQNAFKTIRPIFRERGKINAEVSGRLTESIGGVRVVKGYHAEEREASVFSAGVQRLLENVMRSLTATSTLSFAATTVLGVVGGLVMLLGGHQVLAGRMTTRRLFPIHDAAGLHDRAGDSNREHRNAAYGSRRWPRPHHGILSERDEFADPTRTQKLGPIRGDVAFDQVEFAYEPEKPVLHGISFESRPGTVTALVGSSGSGKSTIISLICAFHKPDKGAVLVDDIDLSTVRLDDYRAQLGVVLQESFLFDGSIRDNVLFSDPDATEEQFLNACRIARVDEFAERFPEAYDTIVGERGVKLSGGQRQRLSIARAILANPRILILDEATSSLDSESEAMIQEGLSFLMQGRTTFVIAHRLSTIRRADQILVVEGGYIVERGTHESLYALGGRYFDLYTRQHGLETNLFLAPGEGDVVEEAK